MVQLVCYGTVYSTWYLGPLHRHAKHVRGIVDMPLHATIYNLFNSPPALCLCCEISCLSKVMSSVWISSLPEFQVSSAGAQQRQSVGLQLLEPSAYGWSCFFAFGTPRYLPTKLKKLQSASTPIIGTYPFSYELVNSLRCKNLS